MSLLIGAALILCTVSIHRGHCKSIPWLYFILKGTPPLQHSHLQHGMGVLLINQCSYTIMRFKFLILALLVGLFAVHHQDLLDGTILMQPPSRHPHLIIFFTSSGHPLRPCLHLCVAEMNQLGVLALMDCGPVDWTETLILLYLWDCIKEEWVSGLCVGSKSGAGIF